MSADVCRPVTRGRPFDQVTARAIGKVGGRRSGQRRKRLLEADVENVLGALDTAEDAQRWIRQLTIWGAAGRMPGATTNACASMLREWIKAQELKRVTTRLRELEHELAERKQHDE